MRRLLRTLNELNWFAIAAFLLLVAAAALAIVIMTSGSLLPLGLLIVAVAASVVFALFSVTE